MDTLPSPCPIEDAPDLGFRNRRFQSVPFSFQKTRDLREENGIFLEMIRLQIQD